jgi:hypothetical protein
MILRCCPHLQITSDYFKARQVDSATLLAQAFPVTMITVVLLKVLGRIFVMVLLCRASDLGCTWYLLLCYLASCPSFAFSCTSETSKPCCLQKLSQWQPLLMLFLALLLLTALESVRALRVVRNIIHGPNSVLHCAHSSWSSPYCAVTYCLFSRKSVTFDEQPRSNRSTSVPLESLCNLRRVRAPIKV